MSDGDSGDAGDPPAGKGPSTTVAAGVGAGGGAILSWIASLGLQDLLTHKPQIAVACVALMSAFSLIVIWLNLPRGGRQQMVTIFTAGAFGIAVLCIVLAEWRPSAVRTRISLSPDLKGDGLQALTIRSDRDEVIKLDSSDTDGEIWVAEGGTVKIGADNLVRDIRDWRARNAAAIAQLEGQRAVAEGESPTE